MAIGGDGFFQLKDANSDSRYYTRAGNFGFDMNGYLTNPEGLVVQGWALDENGEDVGSITDILLTSFTSPPQETGHLEVIVNLDSDGENNTASATSWSLTQNKGADTFAAGTAAANAGAAQNAIQGETLKVYDPDGNQVGGDLTVAAGDSAKTIAAALDALSGVTATAATHAVIDTGGNTQNATNGDQELTINGSNLGNVDLTDAAALAAAINADAALGAAGITAAVDTTDTSLVNVYSADGEDLVFEMTDRGTGVFEAWMDVRGADDAAATTINFGNNGTDVAVAVGGRLDVSFDGAYTIESNQDNQLFAEAGGSITTDYVGSLAAAWDGTADTPLEESDYEYQTTALVYDSLGSTHELTIYFDKAETASSYEFVVTCNPEEDNRTGAAGETWAGKLAHGLLKFDTGGAVSDIDVSTIDPLTGSSTALDETDDGDLTEGYFTFSPTFITGDPMTIKLDFGANYNGNKWVSSSLTTTQYASASNTVYEAANGFGAGDLENVSVDVDGIITGHYSNGQLIPLYRVALAKFQNTQGLFKEGGNLYSQTRESGAAITNKPGTNGLGAISSSSLEQSNVDIADELVKMITTQRGFQANSKIITVTDTMLNDLINIKR